MISFHVARVSDLYHIVLGALESRSRVAQVRLNGVSDKGTAFRIIGTFNTFSFLYLISLQSQPDSPPLQLHELMPRSVHCEGVYSQRYPILWKIRPRGCDIMAIEAQRDILSHSRCGHCKVEM